MLVKKLQGNGPLEPRNTRYVRGSGCLTGQVGALPPCVSGSDHSQHDHICSLLSCSMKRAASLNYLHKSSDASFEVSTV